MEEGHPRGPGGQGEQLRVLEELAVRRLLPWVQRRDLSSSEASIRGSVTRRPCACCGGAADRSCRPPTPLRHGSAKSHMVVYEKKDGLLAKGSLALGTVADVARVAKDDVYLVVEKLANSRNFSAAVMVPSTPP